MQNPLILKVCPKIAHIVGEVRLKVQELKFDDDAEPLIEMIGGDDALGAIVAYTHDLQQPNGNKAGNIFYEMNNQLRDRTAAGRANMMGAWGVPVHYTLKAMSKLPDVERVCFRGFAHETATEKQTLLNVYKNGRPIQWGAFTSTTTSLEAARSFAQSEATGVIFKITVLSGKDICALSFFETEDEVLLGPAHRFVVTSPTGGHVEDGYTTVDLQQVAGEWFKS